MVQWAEQNWELIVLASGILNLLLVVLLFFKSALNKMLFDWYQERRKRKDKGREILLELNERMSSYPTDYLLVLVNIGVGVSAHSPVRVRAGGAVESTNAFLSRHEPVLPKAVRDLVPELRKAIVLPASAVTDGLSKEDFLRVTGTVGAVASKIQAEVRKMV